MWPDRSALGMVASVLAIALLFAFVGFKVGESHAPAIRFELLSCD